MRDIYKRTRAQRMQFKQFDKTINQNDCIMFPVSLPPLLIAYNIYDELDMMCIEIVVCP